MDISQLFFKYCIYYPVVYLRCQNVPKYLRELLESQYLEKEELQEIQLKKLQALVRHAKESVPHFQNHLQNIDPESLKRNTDIRQLPFTTKEMLKKNGAQLLSSQRGLFITKKTTGGSTGEPVTIYKSNEAMARELAATWRGYSWAGVDIGDRQGRFWGVPFRPKDKVRAKLIDFITNRRRCSAFSFTVEDMKDYTQILMRFRPKYFYGYVSMLEEYAKYFQAEDSVPPFNLHCIITTSELLTTYHRQLLESVFSTKVYNEYGCGELGSVAHECEKGSMHIMAENMIVEVLDGERNCGPGEVGELVITELNNKAMPLIRYRTGDFAAIGEKRCGCGRTLPTIVNLVGRAYDTVRNSKGRMFHGEFFMYIFEEAKRMKLGAEAFQVLQRDYDDFQIKVVPGPSYCRQTEEYIFKKIREDFDPEAKVEFVQVAKIERAASGKMRVVIGMKKDNMR